MELGDSEFKFFTTIFSFFSLFLFSHLISLDQPFFFFLGGFACFLLTWFWEARFALLLALSLFHITGTYNFTLPNVSYLSYFPFFFLGIFAHISNLFLFSSFFLSSLSLRRSLLISFHSRENLNIKASYRIYFLRIR